MTIPNEISYLNATKGEPLALSGRTLGGCLDVLVSFPGTPYDRMRTFQAKYANDGIIWMLEPCDLNVTDIRRALWHLDHAGWFRTAKGFVFGRAKNAEDIVNGVNLRISNMAGGFPFECNGDIWADSERLYLCGEYSHNTDEHLSIQKELLSATSGYAAQSAKVMPTSATCC